MMLRKDLVDELIRLTREYYKTRDESLLKELEKVRWTLIQECRIYIGDIDVAFLIEYLAKVSVYVKGATYKDIYKALEIFGVVME